MTGPQASWAAAGTASASADQLGAQRGSQRSSCSRHDGASRSSPAVASVDSAKPADAASSGATSSRTRTAAHSAGRACLRDPVARATRPMVPMTAARRTLGDGRASTTKATRASAETGARQRSPTRSQPHRTRAAARMKATFVPLTATMCVSPVAWKSSFRPGSRPLVSPSTRPGSSPRSSAGSGPAASRRPERSRPATRCTPSGAPVVLGGPRVESRAATSSPVPGLCRRP